MSAPFITIRAGACATKSPCFSVRSPSPHVTRAVRARADRHLDAALRRASPRVSNTLARMDDDKATALLTEIRDLLQKAEARAKETREWMVRLIVVPTYALLV